jgi:hypothetical protein
MPEELGRYDRRIMGPMLEQMPVTLGEKFEVLLLVGRSSGSQDHVVGAGHGVDAVDLDETELVYDSGKIIALSAPLGGGGKAVSFKEEVPCETIRQPGQGGDIHETKLASSPDQKNGRQAVLSILSMRMMRLVGVVS